MVAEGIKTLLTAHVGVSGWQLEVGQLPPTPDRVIMINETGGQPPNPKWLLDYPTAQVLVRGQQGGYLAARAEAIAVKDLLLGLPSQDISGDRWVSITMLSDLGFIGNDENHRPVFSSNFRFIIEPAASAETNREAL